MLRGYWGVILAAVGWVTLSGAAQHQPDARAAYQSEGRAQKPAIAPSSDGGQQAKDPAYYRNPCDYPNTREDSDLCAQWRAANASKSSLDWQRGPQFALGIAEAVGLAVSIMLSAIAAIAGLKAYSGFKGAERAHVFLKSIHVSGIQDDGSEAEVQVNFWNKGATPCWITGLHFAPAGHLPDRPEKVHYDTSFFTAIPDQERGFKRSLGIAPEYFQAFLRGEQRIWIIGSIRYRDIFKASHEMKFAYELTVEGGLDILTPVRNLRYWRYT